MKLRTLFFFLIVLLPISAVAQFTQVSATVTDPNGLAYANGTVVAKLVLPGGTSPTLNGLPYTPPSQPVGLNTAGFFLMQIADNNVLLPAATQWSFTVCSAAGTIQPAGGKGPVCFNAGPITITGASQSITATLNAAALALSLSSGGTTINPTNNAIPRRLNATTFADSALLDNQTILAGVSSSELINQTQGQGGGCNTGNETNGYFISGIGITSIGGNQLNFCAGASGAVRAMDVTGTGINPLIGFNNILTSTNCAAVGTAANPSVASCGAAPAGSFSCATNASGGTCVVNTTIVTSNSEIPITQRADTTTGTRLGVTCNTTVSTVLPVIVAVTAGTSFTINLGTITTNPECFSYSITN